MDAKDEQMNVFRDRDKWRAQVFVDGKRVATQGGFERKSEAKAWHDATLRARKEGPPQSEATFEELLTHFRGWHLPKVRPGTKRRYEVDLKERIVPFFSHRRLADITPRLLEEFAKECQSKLSPKSVNNCLHTLRLMLNKAEKWKLIAESPYGLESLTVTTKPYVWWSKEDDIQKFLAAAKASRYFPVYLLALETGLRYGEIVGLSTRDVDLEQGTIHVHRQWNEREGCYGPTKHGKARFVDFTVGGELGLMLGAQVRAARGERLFVTATGAPVTKSNVAHKLFRASIRRAGVPLIPFHGLRHTFASWYMIRHDNVWDLMAILGHSNIKTTMRYAHQSQRARRKPLDLASITRESHTRLEERNVTSEEEGGKRWRDGRDSNPRAPEKPLSA
jgi:integrase